MSAGIDIAVGGMLAQNDRLSSISNNVANMNTVGYRSHRMSFSEHLYSKVNTVANLPGDVGNGVRRAGTDTNWKEGALSETGDPGHLAIAGDGMFPVRVNGSDQTMYTRAGDFALTGNPQGSGNFVLMRPDGAMLLDGNESLLTFQTAPHSFTIEQDGRVTATFQDVGTEQVGTLKLRRFGNPDALERKGGGLFSPPSNDPDQAAASELVPPGSAGSGLIRQGHLEESNVDLLSEFTDMIQTQKAYQANAKTISTVSKLEQEALRLKM
jgi:flagellar basal body rod protein FlgG